MSKSKVCWSIFLFFSVFFALDCFPECWSSASVPAGGATEIKVLCAKILGQSVPYVTVACTLHLFIFLPPAQQHAKSCSSDFIFIDCLKFPTFVVVFCTRLVTVMLQIWLLISCLLNPHTLLHLWDDEMAIKRQCDLGKIRHTHLLAFLIYVVQHLHQ